MTPHTHITIVLESHPIDTFDAPGMTVAEWTERIKAFVDSFDRGVTVYVAGSPELRVAG